MKPKILFWIDTNYTEFGIAKFLEEKIDGYFYAIYDVNHHIKNKFLKQNIVHFTKQWFYWDYHINTNKNIDMNYLQSFEKKYKIELWKIISSERIFSDYEKFHIFSKNEILSIVERDCKLFENIVDEIKPNFLVIKLADFLRSHLLVELCRAKGVKVLMLIPSRLGYRVYISSSVSDTFNFNNVNVTDENVTFPQIRNYLEKYDKFKQTIKTKSGGVGISPIRKIKAFIDWSLHTYDSEYKKTYEHTGITRSKVLKHKICDCFTIWKRQSFIEKHSTMDTKFSEKFIYFPLHVQPERNIDLDAPYYTNQLEVIKNIARSIPVDYKLYVKEHFVMKHRKWRPISFYKNLISLPNVKFFHPLANYRELIKNSSLVITIAGSTGLEAAFYEKPSIVFTNVSYSNLSCVRKINNFDELPITIRQSLNIKVNPKELYRFILFQEQNSIPFDLTELHNSVLDNFHSSQLIPDIKINIEKLNEFFENRRQSFEILINEYINKIKDT